MSASTVIRLLRHIPRRWGDNRNSWSNGPGLNVQHLQPAALRGCQKQLAIGGEGQGVRGLQAAEAGEAPHSKVLATGLIL